MKIRVSASAVQTKGPDLTSSAGAWPSSTEYDLSATCLRARHDEPVQWRCSSRMEEPRCDAPNGAEQGRRQQ